MAQTESVDSLVTSTDDNPTIFHGVKCGEDECDWARIRCNVISLYGALEDHLKSEHDYTDDEWRSTRETIERAKYE